MYYGMFVMTEKLDESRIRERNEITIPIPVRDILHLEPGDFIRWELNDKGCITVCKSVTMKVNSNCCKDQEKSTS